MAKDTFVDRYVLTATDKTKAATASAIKNFKLVEKQAALMAAGVGAIGGVLTLGAFKALGGAAVAMGEDLGNTAEKIGVTAEQLQVLRLAAEQNGSSAGQLDKAMLRLATNIGEAGLQAQGLSDEASPAGDALRLLGINVLDAGGNVRQAGELFPLIIDALAAIPDQATRAAVAAEIFGRKIGPELAVLINAGSGAFNKLHQFMADTGALIRNDTVQATRELSDQMGRVGDAIRKNFERGFLEAFAGEIEGLDEAISDPKFVAAIHDIGEGIGSALRSISELAPTAIKYLDAIKHISLDIAAVWALGKKGVPWPLAVAISEGAQIINAGPQLDRRPELNNIRLDTPGGGDLSPAEALRRSGDVQQQVAETALKRRLEETKKENERLAHESVAAFAASRKQQIANEQAATARLADIRKRETDDLRAELDRQLDAYKQAQADIKAAQDNIVRAREDAARAATDVQAEFADLTRPARGTQSRADVTLQAGAAQSALNRGDAEAALRQAREAADAMRDLQQAGDASATLSLVGRRLQDIARQAQAQINATAVAAAEAEYAAAQVRQAAIKQTLDELVASAERLKLLPVGFAAEQTLTDAQALRKSIEAALAKPIVVPVTVAQIPGAAAADDAPARAYGGRLPGRSPHARADNILFWGTAGELIIGRPETDALQRRYGSGAIAALLQGRLPDNIPGHALGGLLGREPPRPALPSLPAAAAPRGGDTINLTLPGAGTYTVQADRDTSQALQRAVRLAGIKGGRR